MKIIDLTHTLTSDIPIYPGKCCFSMEEICVHELDIRVSNITLSTGIGTHMDAPYHFDSKGIKIHQIPLQNCVGKASVLHLSELIKDDVNGTVTKEMILEWEEKHGQISFGEIVLIHTGWDKYWDTSEYYIMDKNIVRYPGISKEAAEHLMNKKVLGIGIDTFGLDPGYQMTFPAHQVVLFGGGYIVENLKNLSLLPPKGAFVHLLPMKIINAPEAPLRAYASI